MRGLITETPPKLLRCPSCANCDSDVLRRGGSIHKLHAPTRTSFRLPHGPSPVLVRAAQHRPAPGFQTGPPPTMNVSQHPSQPKQEGDDALVRIAHPPPCSQSWFLVQHNRSHFINHQTLWWLLRRLESSIANRIRRASAGLRSYIIGRDSNLPNLDSIGTSSSVSRCDRSN